MQADGVIHLEAGTHNFNALSDDGVFVFIDGQQIINGDGVHPPENYPGTFTAPETGDYSIKL